MPTNLVTKIDELAAMIGARLGTTTVAASTANNRLDALSNIPVNYLRMVSTNKPITSALTGLSAGTVNVEATSGNLFTNDSGIAVVQRDCIATIIGYASAPPDATNTTGDANGNFRLVIRRKKTNVTGNGNIIIECRTFIKLARHTANLVLPVIYELGTGDRISVESCCYDAARGDGNVGIIIIENPKTIAVPDNIVANIATITSQLASIEARLSLLEQKQS